MYQRDTTGMDFEDCSEPELEFPPPPHVYLRAWNEAAATFRNGMNRQSSPYKLATRDDDLWFSALVSADGADYCYSPLDSILQEAYADRKGV